jgi:hypothetical protein
MSDTPTIRTIGDLMPYAKTQQRAAPGNSEFWANHGEGLTTAILTTQLVRAGMREDKAHDEARAFTKAAAALAAAWDEVGRACTDFIRTHDDVLAAANRAGTAHYTDIRIG